ncbi:unnamed protein product [Miscanthus lutarioriparius]|uniref:Uncharacterized protein n=1 Tax=Miscanthus lutarioriparius TaxID=422564 RepID=A0A811RMT1_9POAL|nr:unnamed protein product [Miscanthus lutarioriparius]
MWRATAPPRRKETTPPPKERKRMVLVPPLFDYPPIAARTRMSVPAYKVMFGKLSLQSLFDDYFDQAGNMTSWIMLKALEEPNIDLIATASAPADKKCGTEVKGDALFRWQKEPDNPHTFVDLLVSTSTTWQLRSSAYYPQYGIGAFGTLPLPMGNRVCSEDSGVVGLRYGSENLSLGASFVPFPLSGEVPSGAWLVGRNGNLSAGVQYKPLGGNKHPMPFTDPKNWNGAISYCIGSTSSLSPLSTFTLELARIDNVILSTHGCSKRGKGSSLSFCLYKVLLLFSHHNVATAQVQEEKVKNPKEDKDVVEITNYIDFGLEFTARIDNDKPTENGNSLFKLAASLQANKNFLLKGKLGPSNSSIVLALKSWWRSSFTFSLTAVKDHSKGTTSFGFGIRTEDLRQPSYERADPNYIMLTPTMEHLAQDTGKRPVFQAVMIIYQQT